MGETLVKDDDGCVLDFLGCGLDLFGHGQSLYQRDQTILIALVERGEIGENPLLFWLSSPDTEGEYVLPWSTPFKAFEDSPGPRISLPRIAVTLNF
jgi:hypothetical protein